MRFSARYVFGILLAGALVSAVLASGPLAEWADAHAERPGGEPLSRALHAWDDLVGEAGQPRTWLRDRSRALLASRFGPGSP